MPFSFSCPQCGTEVAGAEIHESRKVRCPECGALVTAGRSGQKTVNLEPPKHPDETVMLAAVERQEEFSVEPPVEVTDAVEAVDALPLEEPIDRRPIGEPLLGGRGIPTAPDEEELTAAPVQLIARPRKATESEIDMTPMVDVTFLLLIFFMVTATFTLQKSLAIPKNSDQDPSTTVVLDELLDQTDFVTVLVDEFNTYQIVTVDWEREAPSEQDLHSMLRQARSGDSTGTIPTKLRVEAHGDARHQRVVAALDAGAASGFEEVLLASVFDK